VNTAQPGPGHFSLPRLGTHVLAVAAIIVGILGMHVWLGAHDGHRATVHEAGGHGATVHEAGGHGATVLETAGHGAMVAGSETPATGHHVTDIPTLLAAGADTSHGEKAATGCSGSCGSNGMDMAGACVLALMVISIAALLALHGDLTGSSTGRRGPPPPWAPTTAPAQPPSLIQLCISRT
jgi:hypothetical protein